MNATSARILAAIILSCGTMVVVGAHGTADAATLCRKPSGVLALRDGACKNKEVATPLSVVDDDGTPGPVGQLMRRLSRIGSASIAITVSSTTWPNNM